MEIIKRLIKHIVRPFEFNNPQSEMKLPADVQKGGYAGAAPLGRGAEE